MHDDAATCVVVYDGECAFCRQQVAKLQRWDTQRRFEFLPRQSPGLTDRFPALTEGDFNTGMRLVLPDGRIHVGPDAVYEIVRRLPRWRFLAWLYGVPGLHRLLRAAYAWVAVHRYHLSRHCQDSSCDPKSGD